LACIIHIDYGLFAVDFIFLVLTADYLLFIIMISTYYLLFILLFYCLL